MSNEPTGQTEPTQQINVFDLLEAFDQKCARDMATKVAEEVERRTAMVLEQVEQERDLFRSGAEQWLQEREREIREDYRVRLANLSEAAETNLSQLRQFVQREHTKRKNALSQSIEAVREGRSLIDQLETQLDQSEKLHQRTRSVVNAHQTISQLRRDIESGRPLELQPVDTDLHDLSAPWSVLSSHSNRQIVPKTRLLGSLFSHSEFQIKAQPEEQRDRLHRGDICSFLSYVEPNAHPDFPQNWLNDAGASCQVFSAIEDIEYRLSLPSRTE